MADVALKVTCPLTKGAVHMKSKNAASWRRLLTTRWPSQRTACQLASLLGSQPSPKRPRSSKTPAEEVISVSKGWPLWLAIRSM